MSSRHPVFLLLTVIFLSLAGKVKASHIYGGELYYTHVSGLTYKITLTLYGDCSASSSTFSSLAVAAPTIVINLNSSPKDSISLQLEPNSGVDVTPVCAAESNNTSCTGGTIPGVKKYVYSLNYTLPYSSKFWKFIFAGNTGTPTQAGRSSQINNVDNVGTTVMYIQAELNNYNGPNSSPVFTTIPTPFFCTNVAQDYNQGAVDADNDSLVYSLSPALTATGPVTYTPPFTETEPLSTVPGSFSFNTINGQMHFIPDISIKSLVVNKVDEYRNGIKMGSVTREMTFVILANCQNSPPTDSIDLGTVNGGVKTADNIINVCEGGSISFGNIAADPDADTLNVSYTTLPPGALLNVSNNNTTHPYISFNWNTAGTPPGIYNFYVKVKDNGCPLSITQTQGITIRIVRPNSFTSTLLAPTNCRHQAYMQFNLANGLLPRTVEIKQGAAVIRSYTDSTGVILDSLSAGSYTVTVTSPDLLCPSSFSLQIPDGGIYANPPSIVSPIYYCKDDPASALIATPDPGATINWYDLAGNPLPGAPTPNTSLPGTYSWVVTQQYNVCESSKDTIQAVVTLRPHALFNAPATFCIGDTAMIMFAGTAGVSAQYLWNWDGAQVISGQDGGPYRVLWTTPGTKEVSLLVNDNQCLSDTARQQVTVKPRPAASFVIGNICQYQETPVRYTGNPLPGAQYDWTFTNGNPAQGTNIGPYNVVWADTGFSSITLITSLDGCYDTMVSKLPVYPKPEVVIINKPRALCYGDKIFLQAMGKHVSEFTWLPPDKLFYEPDSSIFVRAFEPSTYTVIGTTDKGCTDSSSITYTQIDPCCKFSYPNSFTPNGDGRNDRWRVLVYGNQEDFELTIFDRWGESVFHTFDPTASWDGTYKGQQCELDTYYFYVKSKCLIGTGEENKGEIYLLR